MRGRRERRRPPTGSPDAGSRARWRRRPSTVGFLAGAAAVVPGVFVALLLPAGELILPFLTPGLLLLRPLSPLMASWPGGLTLALGALVNGLVVAATAAGVAAVRARARR